MNILFLEDNVDSISSLVISLRHLGINCTIVPDLNALKSQLANFKQKGDILDLLILDNNIYAETTLEKLGHPEIGTNGGSSTGSQIARLLRSESTSELLKEFKDTPIIINSVHYTSNIESILGDLDDVYIFEKMISLDSESNILNKCKEILGVTV